MKWYDPKTSPTFKLVGAVIWMAIGFVAMGAGIFVLEAGHKIVGVILAFAGVIPLLFGFARLLEAAVQVSDSDRR